MAQIETWLKCDLRKTVVVVPLKGHFFSADVEANRIGVEITNGGVPYPVSGTLVCYGLRSDNVTVVSRANISNSNRPSIALAHDFYDVVGPIQIVLRLVSGNSETVLAACTTYVYKTTSDVLIDSGSALPTIENLVEKINACERAATAANTAASNAESQVSAAQTAAQNAANSASAAQTQAGNAAQSASAAQTQASNAASSASAAATQASNAAQSASAAQTRASNAASSADAAATSAAQAAQSASTAQSQVATAQQAAATAQSQAGTAQQAAAAAQQSASQAASSAGQAATQAANAAADAALASDTADAANRTANSLSALLSEALATIVQGGEVRGNALYLLNGEGDEVAGPFTGFGGGGGGGGGGNSNVTMTFGSTDGNYMFTCRKEDQMLVSITWSSVETIGESETEPTGSGQLNVIKDSRTIINKSYNQGTFQVDLTNFLDDGENTFTFRMTDAYGNRRTKTFTVNRMNLLITSTFDDSVDQYGDVDFPFVPYGSGSKTVYFLIDGHEVGNRTVSSQGRTVNYTITKAAIESAVQGGQFHGGHSLTVYYSTTMNGETVYSNELHYDITCIDPNEDDVIITSAFDVSSVNQYSTVVIPYRVYTPGSQTSMVTIAVNGVSVTEEPLEIGRTKTSYSIRLDESGTTTISISSGNAMKMFVLTVNEVTMGAVAETEGLELYLSSQGRSNNEATPNSWTYDQNGTTIAATFSGFNWVTDGWQLDDDGVSVMRVTGDARITIPYKPFETDKRTTGYTIEFDFATSDVRNYSTPVISCMNGGRGLEITSQKATINSEGSNILTQFKEEEHVRVSFVIEKRSDHRLIYCYMNGILSRVSQYPDNDNFQQQVPQNITIGCDDATIDIYTIRAYRNNLSMEQMEHNWIADTPDGSLMLTRFGENNIRDENGNIVISQLPGDLPYMIITAEELPQYKGDKKTCSGSYVDPLNEGNNFTFTDCQIDVQGTSSQFYARKNYKMKFNGGFTDSSGNTSSKYKLRSTSIAVKTFCMKADVASSEGTNNVELVRLYNDTCPYKTPAQVQNPNIRQGIDGFPIVIFWENSLTNQVTFLGKYNFNNDKGTDEVYGFVSGDESWEVKMNDVPRTSYKSNDFVSMGVDDQGNPIPDWQNDFECRYPGDDYFNYVQLRDFITWVMSTDPDTATGDALPEPVSFGETAIENVYDNHGLIVDVIQTPVTHTIDNAAYRKAKFKAELSQYAEVNSVLFYYLFTELFLMVDSRAKNSFPSFMGTPIGGNGNGNE